MFSWVLGSAKRPRGPSDETSVFEAESPSPVRPLGPAGNFDSASSGSDDHNLATAIAAPLPEMSQPLELPPPHTALATGYMPPRSASAGATPKSAVDVLSPAAAQEARVRAYKLMACTAGIMLSLIVYSVLQERMMSQPYGTADRQVTFGNSIFLVFSNRIYAVVISALVILVSGTPEDLKPVAPIHEYFMISLGNVIATSCQYEALKWVTFPTQTLLKCMKIVSVMMVGTLIAGKTYRWSEYFYGLLVAVGCTIFLSTGSIAASEAAPEDSWFGVVLMGFYLAFDSFTSTFQEVLFSGFDMSVYNQILYVNVASVFVSGVLLVISGQMAQSIAFGLQFPVFWLDLAILSLSAVASQFCISYTIREFGALVYARIMTVRQFASVLISNLLYTHAMNGKQWIGTTLVFTSLLAQKQTKSLNRAPTSQQ